MQSIKTYTFIVYMIPDHKQKVLHMRYRDGYADYFGKKGINDRTL